MKKKIVRQLYKEAAERIARYTKLYRLSLIAFEDLLLEIANALAEEDNTLFTAVQAGTITAEEHTLITERLEMFTKKELKNICKA
jgi:hypothetical protein